MPLTSEIQARIRASQTRTLDLGTPDYTPSSAVQIMLGTGTAANCADLMFTDSRTLSASGTENLDLAGGLVDAFGTTLTFVEVRAVLILASALNTNDVQLTRPASNGVPLFLASSDGIAVGPGGVFLWACPADGKVTVTPATGDLLTVTNSAGGTSVTYDVVVLGTSA